MREQHPLQSRRSLDRVGRRGRTAQAVGLDCRQAAHRLPGARRRSDVSGVPSQRVPAGVRKCRQVHMSLLLMYDGGGENTWSKQDGSVIMHYNDRFSEITEQ